MDQLPKYSDIFRPILEILSDGNVLSARELRKRLMERYYAHLPLKLLNIKVSSGQSLIFNRMDWAKFHLKANGCVVYPERGSVKITEKGLKEKDSPTLIEDIQIYNKSFYEGKGYGNEGNHEHYTKTKDLTPQDLIDKGFNQIESEVKRDLLARLKEIDPFYFEKIILILLKKMGYGEYEETSKTRDGGIDGIINEDQLGLDKIYIQAKRFNSNKVTEMDIRNFIGAMSGDTNKGVFVTTSEFDREAIKKAKGAHHKIILIDGNKLVNLMYQYNVGIQVREVYEIKSLDNDFFMEE